MKDDEVNESKIGEVTDNGVGMTKAEKCENVSNLIGEEPDMVEKENVPVLPEVENEGDSKVEGGGDVGGSREAVVVKEDAAVELKAEAGMADVGNKATEKVEGSGGGECALDTAYLSEAVVAAVELKEEAEAAATAVSGGEEELALNEGSEPVALEEDVLPVDEEMGVTKSCGANTLSDGDDVQADVTEPLVTSEGTEEIVEESGLSDGNKDVSDLDGLGDQEKDVSDYGFTGLDISKSAVVAKGDHTVAAEEEISVVVTTEVNIVKVGDKNAVVEVHESVVEKDDNILVAQSTEKQKGSEVEVTTENEGPLPSMLEDSEIIVSESAVAIRDDKLDEETQEVIATAGIKMEMEINDQPKVSGDEGNEGENVCKSHDLGICGEVPAVANDVLEGSSNDENLADNAQMEKEKQNDMEASEASSDQDDLKLMVEKRSVQLEKDEVEGIMEDNSSVLQNNLESQKGLEMDIKKSKDGELVDSKSTFADKRGGVEEARMKEEDTARDVATDILMGSMDGTNNGVDEEAEAKEEAGAEDTGDGETEREVENMEVMNDGEEDEAMADKERNMDVSNNGEDEEVEAKEETGTEDTRDVETEREVENMEIMNDGDGDGDGDGEGEAVGELDGPKSPHGDEHEAMADEETTTVDTDVETETDVAESGKAAGGKRKRGKNKSPTNSKVAGKAHRIMEEDVCFICFDGGELVLCDRRGCPKAYHPSCVNRDDAFFRSKGRWNCGWHLCSICEKNAHYMCYTCTFSLCKGCTKDAVILCIRGNKGFCEACMRTIMLIEKNEQDQVDFDDKSSWEYLFKDYYIDLKSKLSLTSAELAEAKNPCKGSGTPASKQGKVSSGVREKVSAGKQESPEPLVDTSDGADIDADTSNDYVEARKSKRRKVKTRSKALSKEENFSDGDNSTPGDTEWASKELLEFVMHMRNGDRSLLSQYDVQALLLEYIKRNNLRDPRQKSRIICDSRLQSLFGKQRVGHFEMLKLLESHFLIKDDSQTDDVQASVVDTEIDKLEVDGNTDAVTKGIRDKKRKTRRKGGRAEPQSNLDDYAAIDMHNIGLIYLRRKLMEDLLEDVETFNDKVVGTFVRIRISGSAQKQDLYRLVQVLGTTKAAEPYKVGKKSTDITVEILNLNKTEVVSIDTISNQDFTEEECKRLRQSIKCGLINRLTVGDMLDKATELQTTRVNDWLESEIMRLSHLRDRASEKGRKKELRECVEKLQLLKTPEERQRRLEEIPEIHADPRMDPSYESEEDENESNDNRREFNTKVRGSGSRGGRGPVSPGSDFFSKDSWSSGGKYPSKNWDQDRNLSTKNTLVKGGDNSILTAEAVSENQWHQGRDRNALESSNMKFGSSVNSETIVWNSQDVSKSELFTAGSSVTSPSSISAGVAEPTVKINESEKMWHYKDPSGKVQGPFSMVQLRKWSNTGYFPTDLKIWRATEKQDDTILLTDALAGKFQKESVAAASTLSGNLASVVMTSLQQAREGHGGEKLKIDKNNAAGNLLSHMGSPRVQTTPSIELPKVSTETWSRNDLTNLPSPTPTTKNADLTGQGVPLAGATSSSQSPAAVLPEYLARSSLVASVMNSSRIARAAETDPNNSVTGLSAVPTPEPGSTVVSANTLQNSQSAMATEPHAIQMHNHVVTAQDMVVPPVQSVVNSQNPIVETHGWGGAPAQKVEANPSIPVSGQQQPYSQWGVIPSTVPTHASNFSSSGTSPLPPSELWGPAQASQPNMQHPAMPSMPWAGGMTESNNPAPVFRPENSNFGWNVMQGNPNMGWVGAPPLNANMNWAPTIQGPPPGNAAAGWTMPTGNPGGAVQGQMPASANTGWVAAAGNPAVQGLGLGNANQSWIPPTGSVTPTAQGPYPVNGWAPPAGNPGPSVQGPVSGNVNQGWVAPAANQGTWQSGQNYGRGKFSGQRENGSHGGETGFGSGRPWNRQASFGNGGSSRHFPRHQTPCPYNKNGQCRKGASCNYLHT